MRAFPEHLEQYRNLSITQCDGLDFPIYPGCVLVRKPGLHICVYLYIFGKQRSKSYVFSWIYIFWVVEYCMFAYMIRYTQNCKYIYIRIYIYTYTYIYIYNVYVLYTVELNTYRVLVSRVWMLWFVKDFFGFSVQTRQKIRRKLHIGWIDHHDSAPTWHLWLFRIFNPQWPSVLRRYLDAFLLMEERC